MCADLPKVRDEFQPESYELEHERLTVSVEIENSNGLGRVIRGKNIHTNQIGGETKGLI